MIEKNYYPLFEEYDSDYYYINQEDSIIIYDNNDKVVNAFPDSYMPSFNGDNLINVYVDGVIIMQRFEELPNEEVDYSVIVDGVKYNVITKTYNILTGASKVIEVDYLITNKFWDDNLSDEYLQVSVAFIEDKILFDKQEYMAVIKKSGDIAINSYFDSSAVYYNGYYWDLNNNSIYNQKLELITNIVTDFNAEYMLYFYSIDSKIGCYSLENEEIIFEDNYTLVTVFDSSALLKDEEENYYVFDFSTQEINPFTILGEIALSYYNCIVTYVDTEDELRLYDAEMGELIDTVSLTTAQSTFAQYNYSSFITTSTFRIDPFEISSAILLEIDLGDETLVYKYVITGEVAD